MTSLHKWTVGVSIMMIIFSSLTLIMTAKYFFESTDQQSKATDNLYKSMEVAKETAKWQRENSIAMNRLVNAYEQMNNLNITYEIGTS